MEDRKKRDWKELARAAAGEDDPQKLLALVHELNATLEEDLRIRRGERPRAAGQAASKRLLFVDDELSIRVTLPPLLQRYGFEVRVAGSVPEAVVEIENHNFDVLLSDLNIGQVGDGFEVVRAMRAAHPDCVTILLTGYPAFETAVQAIHDEVDDYVVKPADIEALVSTIERKLARRASARHES